MCDCVRVSVRCIRNRVKQVITDTRAQCLSHVCAICVVYYALSIHHSFSHLPPGDYDDDDDDNDDETTTSCDF